MADLQLLTPTELGAIELRNRVVMAPLTRNRTPERVPTDLQVEYYRQRAGAGLIVTEATVVSPTAVGYDATPGIWSDEQVEAWRKVTDAVHEEGGKIVVQLWHTGRVSHELFFDGDAPVSSTDRPAENAQVFAAGEMREPSTPRALATDELPGIVEDFANATRNARAAGFDGVEVHAANGYLLEQFLAAEVNDRDDEYGGSSQARAKFPLEVMQAVVDAWDAEHVGVRLSLGNGTFGAVDEDPIPTLTAFAEGIAPMGLAYVHMLEEFVRDATGVEEFDEDERTTLLRETVKAPVLVNGGYDRETGESAIENGRATGVVYGKPFISNPDLVTRFEQDADLNEWDQSTFYGGGAEGYTDYPTLEQANSA